MVEADPTFSEVFKFLKEKNIDFSTSNSFVLVWNINDEDDLISLVTKFTPTLSTSGLEIYCRGWE